MHIQLHMHMERIVDDAERVQCLYRREFSYIHRDEEVLV